MPKKDYDKIHRANMDVYARKIQAVYDSAVKEAAAISSTVSNFDPFKPFSFSDYPITHNRVKKLSNELQSNLEAVVLNGIDHEWTLSNNKNNELCNRLFGDNVGKLTKEQYRRYYSNNSQASDAFKARKVAELNLSDRVWRYTDKFKTEIELGIDLDLRDGTSAADMARNLKQYLQNPDKLFRRVRDQHGQLHLSKAAKAFKPGQGVYRSSVKNAERLARTETNMAYHTADHERWQQFDFVVGVEVRRSNNLSCHCPLCDTLAGKYPKDFKFTGWHPQCRCSAVPVLKTIEELKGDTERIINGQPTNTESVNTVNQMPDSFTSWIEENKGRFGATNTPYFIRDNFKEGKIAEGLRFANKLSEEAVTTVMNATVTIIKASPLDEIIQMFEKSNIDYNDVKELPNQLTEMEIVSRVGGGDLTKGSCSSLAFTYVGNKCGLDVLDFRDGASRQMFSSSGTIMNIAEKVGGVVNKNVNDFANAKTLLTTVKEGKEYYFTCGKHASIVRKTSKGYEYLELQSATDNGFKPLNNNMLKRRFGAKKSHTLYGNKYEVQECIIDIELLKNDTGFQKMLGYINTIESKQRKGTKGTIKIRLTYSDL